MRDNPKLSRRRFLRNTGQAAIAMAAISSCAPVVLSAPSPSKTIGMGCIGRATRGGDLINAVVNAPNVEAVCDVYGPHRQKGVKEVNWDLWLGPAPKIP